MPTYRAQGVVAAETAARDAVETLSTCVYLNDALHMH
jgi:hypothetical protein